jgi:hypothetical protein
MQIFVSIIMFQLFYLINLSINSFISWQYWELNSDLTLATQVLYHLSHASSPVPTF